MYFAVSREIKIHNEPRGKSWDRKESEICLDTLSGHQTPIRKAEIQNVVCDNFQKLEDRKFSFLILGLDSLFYRVTEMISH